VGELARDPDFQKGFREGWNSSVSSEYRY